MIQKLRKLRANDAGVSPVVGTILMVAVTVILGAAVYAAVNGFGGDATEGTTDAVFRAQSIDTNGNGGTDRIKITYIAGPPFASTIVKVNITNSLGAPSALAVTTAIGDGEWTPGDFVISGALGKGDYFVQVAVRDTVVLDHLLRVEE